MTSLLTPLIQSVNTRRQHLQADANRTSDWEKFVPMSPTDGVLRDVYNTEAFHWTLGARQQPKDTSWGTETGLSCRNKQKANHRAQGGA